MECVTCESKTLLESSWHLRGDNGDLAMDLPDHRECLSCGAEYVDEELFVDYFLHSNKEMPVSVREHIQRTKGDVYQDFMDGLRGKT